MSFGQPARVDVPRLYRGEVVHARYSPRRHAFRHSVFFVALPLSQLRAAENLWFGVNRHRLLSVHFADYGPGDGTAPAAWLGALLAREGIRADGEIVLQTFPRVLGYVFNPVSFWYCHDCTGALRAIVAEVNNTFGERHCYLLAREDAGPIATGATLAAHKVFHVSPFFDIDGGYRFRFRIGAERSLARIDLHARDGALLLHTRIAGRSVDWRPHALLGAWLAHPFMTIGIIARIHLEAARLWWKGVRFHRKPAPPRVDVTRSETTPP
jgi:hypothetical protein